MKPERSSRRGLAIALTGGIACGKSAAGEAFAAAGAKVLDTDAVGHALLRRGSPVLGRVVELFGAGVLGEGGDADRGRIAELVFADPAALARLNAVMHPAIMARAAEMVRETTAAGDDAVVMVPLLFEIGAEKGWDAVVCVVADEDRVMERLRARGWTDDFSRRRMAAQWPVAEKARRADIVIENNGARAELNGKVAAAYKELRKKERNDHG